MSDELMDKIPEKFRGETLEASIDKLVNSYGEAEKKLGESNSPPQFESHEALLDAASVKMQDLSGEWMSNEGKLRDETYAKFQKLGVPRWQVDKWAGAEAQHSALLTETVMSAAGGEKAFESLKEWASGDAPKRLADEYEDAVQRRDIRAAREATAKLAEAFAKQSKSDDGDGLIRGDNLPVTGASPFGSYQEKQEAAGKLQRGEISMEDYDRRLAATRKRNPSAMVAAKPDTF